MLDDWNWLDIVVVFVVALVIGMIVIHYAFS